MNFQAQNRAIGKQTQENAGGERMIFLPYQGQEKQQNDVNVLQGWKDDACSLTDGTFSGTIFAFSEVQTVLN